MVTWIAIVVLVVALVLALWALGRHLHREPGQRREDGSLYRSTWGRRR